MEGRMSRGILYHRRQLKTGVATVLAALMSCGLAAADDRNDRPDGVKTATPIKHVIVLIGENRTFDNVYGTYVAKHEQRVDNLLSRGIVRPDGSPGPRQADARQFQIGRASWREGMEA